MVVGRWQHLAPEEIAGMVLLAAVLVLALLRSGPISQLFESPYSTPAPGGGPGRQVVPAAPSPASVVPSYRVIGANFPLAPDPAHPPVP